MDKRKNNKGTIGNKGGRPPKVDEKKLVQHLSKLDEAAFKCLEKGIKDGNYNFWNKFMEFRFGKPKERLDLTSGDKPMNVPVISYFETK